MHIVCVFVLTNTHTNAILINWAKYSDNIMPFYTQVLVDECIDEEILSTWTFLMQHPCHETAMTICHLMSICLVSREIHFAMLYVNKFANTGITA